MKTQPSQNKNKGAALLYCLVFVMLLSLVVVSLLSNEARTAQLLKRDLASTQAYYLAESGLLHGVALMEQGLEGSVGPTKMGKGIYRVAVSEEGGGFLLKATGTVPVPPSDQAEREVQAIVSRTSTGEWEIVSRIES